MQFPEPPEGHKTFLGCQAMVVVSVLLFLIPGLVLAASTQIPWNPSQKTCTLKTAQKSGVRYDYDRDGVANSTECVKYGVLITDRTCPAKGKPPANKQRTYNPMTTIAYSCTDIPNTDLAACAKKEGYAVCRIHASCKTLSAGSEAKVAKVIPFYGRALGDYTAGMPYVVTPALNNQIGIDTFITSGVLPNTECLSFTPNRLVEYPKYTIEISVAGLSEPQAVDMADSFRAWAGSGKLGSNVTGSKVDVIKDQSYPYRDRKGKPLYDLSVARITIDLETELRAGPNLLGGTIQSEEALEDVLNSFTYGFLSLPLSTFTQPVSSATWPGRMLIVRLLSPSNPSNQFFAQLSFAIAVTGSPYGNYPLQFTNYPDKVTLDLADPVNPGENCGPVRDELGGVVPEGTVCFPFDVSVGKGNGKNRSVDVEVVSQTEEQQKFFSVNAVVSDADVAKDVRTVTLALVPNPQGKLSVTGGTAINLHLRFINRPLALDADQMRSSLLIKNTQITLTGSEAPMIQTNNGSPVTTMVAPGSDPVVVSLTAKVVTIGGADPSWSSSPQDLRFSLDQGGGVEDATFSPGSEWTKDSQVSFVVEVSNGFQSDSITLNFVGASDPGGGGGGGDDGGGGGGGGGGGDDGGGGGGGDDGGGGGGGGGGDDGFVHDLISTTVQTQVSIELDTAMEYGSKILSWESVGAASGAITWKTGTGIAPYGVGQNTGNFSYYRPYGKASGSENDFKVEISDIFGNVLETFPIDISFN